MNELVDLRGMSVNGYCDFLMDKAVYLGVSPFEFNIRFFDKDMISMVKFDLATHELNMRREEAFWLQRGEVIR